MDLYVERHPNAPALPASPPTTSLNERRRRPRQWLAVPSVTTSSAAYFGRNASTTPASAGPSLSGTTSTPSPLASPTALDPSIDTITLDDKVEQATEGVGYLHQLGLDYGWGPTSMLQWVLEQSHYTLGLPWWAAIAATGISLRLVMIPLFVKSADSTARQSAMLPLTKPITDEMWRLRKENKHQEAMQTAARFNLIKQQAGISTRDIYVPMILQGVFGYCGFKLMRAMAMLPVPGLDNGGVLWLTDLTVTDPFFIAPTFMALTMHTVIRLGGETGATNVDAFGQSMRNMMLYGMPAMIFLATGVCKDMLIQLATKGLRCPPGTLDAMKRMWFIMDLPLNVHRIACIRSTSYLTNQHLYNAQAFFLKVDMAFTAPAGRLTPAVPNTANPAQVRYANVGFVGCSLRKLLTAERHFTSLWRVLRGWSWDPATLDRPMTRLDVVRLWVRHKYTLPDEAPPEARRMPILDIPWHEIGTASLERTGVALVDLHGSARFILHPALVSPDNAIGLAEHRRQQLLYPHDKRLILPSDRPREVLLRPEQLVLREAIRRQMGLHRHWVHMMLYGLVDEFGHDFRVLSEQEYSAWEKGKKPDSLVLPMQGEEEEDEEGAEDEEEEEEEELAGQEPLVFSCLSRWTSPISLCARLCPQVLLFDLGSLQRWETEMMLSTVQTLPQPNCLPVIPYQRANPGLHIPVQRQHRVRSLRDLACNVRDLIFRFLGIETNDAGGCAGRVGPAGDNFGLGLGLGLRLGFGFLVRVDVGVGVQRSEGGGNDGVPDDGFGGGSTGVARRRRVGGCDVEEDLFGVPIEEGS
nr:mitochondrial inner membrane protein oxa1 [Quercus suber]